MIWTSDISQAILPTTIKPLSLSLSLGKYLHLKFIYPFWIIIKSLTEDKLFLTLTKIKVLFLPVVLTAVAI